MYTLLYSDIWLLKRRSSSGQIYSDLYSDSTAVMLSNILITLVSLFCIFALDKETMDLLKSLYNSTRSPVSSLHIVYWCPHEVHTFEIIIKLNPGKCCHSSVLATGVAAGRRLIHCHSNEETEQLNIHYKLVPTLQLQHIFWWPWLADCCHVT